MSSYHFTQEDHEYMRQIGKELEARRERNDPPLDNDGLMDLVESVVNRVVAPPWHAVYDTREFVAVPVAELERWCKTLRGALDKTDPHPLGGRKVMPGGAAIDVLEVWTLINSLIPTAAAR